MGTELKHYGVKGMHWGQRKAERAAAPRHSGYSEGAQTGDRKKFGQKGVDRINENLHKGMHLSKARAAEQTRRKNIKWKILGGYMAARLIYVYGTNIAQATANSYVNSKNEAAGKKYAADMFSDVRGIGNHKIVDIGYDPTTNVWG